MAFLTMYTAKVNSPVATLASSLTAVTAGTVETVDVSEGTFFPAPPGLATIGTGNLAETVLYTDRVGNTLTIERGFEGPTNNWSIGTPIGRFFTAYDHETFINNINELNAVKADQTGTYANLRAQATTKTDVGLGNVDDVQQAPLTHVGAIGAAHGVVTTSTNGFMSSTDKTKLNGIESGATADQTAAQIRDALKTVDGSGSGVDADLLDGKHASAFQLAGTYNTIIGTDSDINTSGGTIIDNIFVTDGVITSMGTRVLTAGDIGAATTSHTHDSRYYTESEANSLFLNESSNLSDLPNKATARANLEIEKITVSTTAPVGPATNDI